MGVSENEVRRVMIIHSELKYSMFTQTQIYIYIYTHTTYIYIYTHVCTYTYVCI